MEPHRILVISDTHGLLRPEVLRRAADCEAVLHAGDIDRPEILERLKAVAPVYAVRGNVDGKWAQSLPEELELELFGFRIYMLHNRKSRKKKLSEMDADRCGIDMVICGHSHEYKDFHDKYTGMPYLNPGSCGPKRFRLPATMMELILYPEEHRWEAVRLDCESLSCESMENTEEDGTACAKDGLPEKDLYQLVKKVMKGMQSGKSVSQMAERYRAQESLVEDICRMYATHSGIGADGDRKSVV